MQPPYRGSAHRAAAKDAYDRPLVGGMKGARFGHWWRRRGWHAPTRRYPPKQCRAGGWRRGTPRRYVL